MKLPMGKLIAGGFILVAGFTPVRAEEFPWCVKMDVFTKNCAFTKYDECATVAKNGNGACIRNPDYQPPLAAAARPKAKPAAARTQPAAVKPAADKTQQR